MFVKGLCSTFLLSLFIQIVRACEAHIPYKYSIFKFSCFWTSALCLEFWSTPTSVLHDDQTQTIILNTFNPLEICMYCQNANFQYWPFSLTPIFNWSHSFAPIHHSTPCNHNNSIQSFLYGYTGRQTISYHYYMKCTFLFSRLYDQLFSKIINFHVLDIFLIKVSRL